MYVCERRLSAHFCRYYKGKIGRQESEKILLEQDRNGYYIQPEGAFLVRNSETDREKYSISVK